MVICTVPSLYAVDGATPTAYDPLNIRVPYESVDETQKVYMKTVASAKCLMAVPLPRMLANP